TGWFGISETRTDPSTSASPVPCLQAVAPAGILDPMNEVTQILSAIDQGDPHAAAQLLPLVYDELRKLAAGHLANEDPGHTLVATGFVHEAYRRLVGDQRFENAGHFFAAAAEAMRRILLDRARRKNRLKHGGGRMRVDLEAVGSLAEEPAEDLEVLDESLNKL